MPSGGALNGSPLSGGYAGAKATVRFITSYAGIEAQRAGLGIGFTAYANRQGVDVESFVQAGGPALTAQQVGKSVLEIATGEPTGQDAYLLTSAGLSPLA
ncbi:hypothetical protein [Mycobacterium sp. MUNTM1]